MHVSQPLAAHFPNPFADASSVIEGRSFAPRTPSSFSHAHLSLANLRLVKQTVTTNPQEGAIEYDGTAFYATMSGIRRAITLGNDTMVANVVVANTVVETTLHTSPVAATEMKAGSMYLLRLYGKFSTANASDAFNLKFKIGSATIFTAALTPGNVTDVHCRLEFVVTVRTVGAGGTYAAHLEGVFGDQVISITPVAGSVDTTAAEDLVATLQWDNALAGNTFTLMQSVLVVIN